MDISIQRVETLGPDIWQVHACGAVFSFGDQSSAVAFADKLKERVEADHHISESVLQRWAEEHNRMLDTDLS
ncbi:hypothetical protein [Pseudomonas panipatensis]|uniref:Uncharacterized protein n=1 Tax=Pseudomonas panipatensis TaxID=428992 RepID=A0A1G8LH88_9PSED|nr:hypothetical protein [Pseudomonas panipatensis]SDI55064.1 hypothetical protein SAMN05216272_111153 [Pseudomonas panipatensis]SMP74911.1 hypothetical protein SAMN06295951_11347 [Pseudomonas panipatensis]